MIKGKLSMITTQKQHYGSKKLWVIKIGSAMITNEGAGLDHHAIAAWVNQIAVLKQQGKQIVIVSSGAVAEGMKRLGWTTRPIELNRLQAAAAVGQMNLAAGWDAAFQNHQIHTAQILLTHEDAADRQRYLNVQATLQTLLSQQVVPIINENDTTTFEEIRFGDNDTLGALVAALLNAELYIILTDQQGLYEKDPRQNPEAKLLPEVDALDPKLLSMADSKGGSLGRGGMYTKVTAAQKAAKAGTATWIVYGRHQDVLLRVANGENLGTLFVPQQSVLAAKKRWLLNQMQAKGELIVDQGAVSALLNNGKSLLPVGILNVNGQFHRGDIVICRDENGAEIGRGICNYAADEVRKIARLPSAQIFEQLGFCISEAVIHRDNWVNALGH